MPRNTSATHTVFQLRLSTQLKDDLRRAALLDYGKTMNQFVLDALQERIRLVLNADDAQIEPGTFIPAGISGDTTHRY